MHCVKKISDNLYWVGGNDRRLTLFENIYPIPRGVSYNSYLMMDEKTVLLDTVDHSISRLFLENVEYVLNGRKLDYLIINHMEPDHCATIADILSVHPEVTIVASAKAIPMLSQFFDLESGLNTMAVKEGDTLETGSHTLTFVMAPMVHWPEVMVTYDSVSKILYSADAFGTFGAINGNLFADEMDFKGQWLDDARRYYTNIVGKYGPQVQALLKKAAALDIQILCPLHGPVWRSDIDWFVDKYQKWSTYTPEDTSVMIAYASIYGGTENAAEIMASLLADAGVKNIAVYDVSNTDPSVLLSEAFRCSHLVLASVTYNADIFIRMENFLMEMKSHGLQNRTVALMYNGSWAATAGKKMADFLAQMKNMTVLENPISIKSTLKQDQYAELEALAAEIMKTM